MVDLAEEEKFIAGELVSASKAPVRRLGQGTLLVAEGEYWSSPCKLCGVVKNLLIRGPSDLEVRLQVEGTTHEELLKWVTGNPGVPLRLHLCGEGCDAKLDAKDLVHAKRLRLKRRENEEDWTENLKGAIDELAVLRREAEEAEPAKRKEESKKEKKKKKKKKARGEKSSDSSSLPRDKTKGQKRKLSSQKGLEAVYGSTGLDPDPRVRKRLLRRWKKKMKKKKDSSSGSSGSSLEGSSQASTLNSSESGQVFEETNKVRRLARKAPGLLTFSMVKEMQRQLLTAAGTLWDTEKTAVPPVSLQYYRSQLAPRLSGGASREALTLSWALDFGFARQNGSSSRLPQPKTEEFGNDCGRSQLGCLTTSGSSPPRTGALVKQSGSPGGCKRGEAGEQNPADDKGKGKRKNRHWGRSLASQWKRRSERQGSRQGQKRQREGGEQEELLGKGARGNRMSLLSDIRGVDQSAEGFFKPHEEPFDAHGKILHPGLATVCRPVTGNPTPSDDLKGSGSALNVGPTLLDTNYQFSKEQMMTPELWGCADGGAALSSPSRCSGGISSHLLGGGTVELERQWSEKRSGS